MKHMRGFTLIEMAIVLVVITLLIGGLMAPLTAQIQARQIAETKRTLEEAREAIMGYAMTHVVDHDNDPDTPSRPYLPCPDTDGNGRENRNGNICDSASGLFPWVELGTASHDAWGNRLRYSVENRVYADKSKGMPNLALDNPPPTLNLKQICLDSACGTLVAEKLPVVLLSHGPNGRGARNKSIEFGTATPAPPSATGPDELANINGVSTFVSRAPFKAVDDAEDGNDFDDLVVWISDGVLRSRVCPPGGCP